MSVHLLPIVTASNFNKLRKEGKFVVGCAGGAYVFDTERELEQYKLFTKSKKMLEMGRFGK
jgi:hypothetical protein